MSLPIGYILNAKFVKTLLRYRHFFIIINENLDVALFQVNDSVPGMRSA